MENKNTKISGEIINTATLKTITPSVGTTYTTAGKVTADAEALAAEAYHAIIWDYSRQVTDTIGKGDYVLRAMSWASEVHPEMCALIAIGEIARKNRELAQYQVGVR